VSASQGVPAEIRLYDRLFKVPNPAAEEDSLGSINEDSLVVKQGVVEPSLIDVEVTAPVQFERTGYFCKDKDSQGNKLVFNRAVGLRDTWAKMDQA
jgi:glutaminyl-tRNA synthetase